MSKTAPKIEFYALLPKIKKMYFDNGIVFATTMYKTLQNENKIQMSYVQFNTYFRRELVVKKEQKSDFLTPKKEPINTQKNVEDLTKIEILKLIEEGKISDEEITKLEENGKIEYFDLPRKHTLYTPKGVKYALQQPKVYVHNAGVPDSTIRMN